jgi:hypothetical protein
MKREDKILTYEQAKELKWFCQYVLGTRQDYYSVMDKANSFDLRLQRLEKTCKLIEEFFGEQLKTTESAFFKDSK